MKLFAKTEVNTTRQWAFDFTKTLAIFFMVFVHTFIYVYGEENMDHGFQYHLNNIYGGALAAPAFMFSMGVGIAYSRRSDAVTMALRGIKLLFAGYLLNALRALPHLLMWHSGYGEQQWTLFLEEILLFDILQFAGTAFLLFALLRRVRANAHVILGVSVALSLYGTAVRGVDMGSPLLNLLSYPFVGIHVRELWTSFPLFHWFIFVAAGYWFGKLLRRCTDVDRLYALLTPITGGVFIIGMTYLTIHSVSMFSAVNDDYFYYLTPFDAFVCISGALMVAGLGHFLMPHEPHVLREQVQRISADVTRIYLVHWIFVSYLVGALLTDILSLALPQSVTLTLSLLILLLSAWLARRAPISNFKI